MRKRSEPEPRSGKSNSLRRPVMSLDATASATGKKAAAHQLAPPSSLRVIPVVDVALGAVMIVVNGRVERYRHRESRVLARALSQCVRPARWFPETRTLTLTVAAAGHHTGLERHFRFESASDEPQPSGVPQWAFHVTEDPCAADYSSGSPGSRWASSSSGTTRSSSSRTSSSSSQSASTVRSSA